MMSTPVAAASAISWMNASTLVAVTLVQIRERTLLSTVSCCIGAPCDAASVAAVDKGARRCAAVCGVPTRSLPPEAWAVDAESTGCQDAVNGMRCRRASRLLRTVLRMPGPTLEDANAMLKLHTHSLFEMYHLANNTTIAQSQWLAGP